MGFFNVKSGAYGPIANVNTMMNAIGPSAADFYKNMILSQYRQTSMVMDREFSKSTPYKARTLMSWVTTPNSKFMPPRRLMAPTT